MTKSWPGSLPNAHALVLRCNTFARTVQANDCSSLAFLKQKLSSILTSFFLFLLCWLLQSNSVPPLRSIFPPFFFIIVLPFFVLSHDTVSSVGTANDNSVIFMLISAVLRRNFTMRTKKGYVCHASSRGRNTHQMLKGLNQFTTI